MSSFSREWALCADSVSNCCVLNSSIRGHFFTFCINVGSFCCVPVRFCVKLLRFALILRQFAAFCTKACERLQNAVLFEGTEPGVSPAPLGSRVRVKTFQKHGKHFKTGKDDATMGGQSQVVFRSVLGRRRFRRSHSNGAGNRVIQGRPLSRGVR